MQGQLCLFQQVCLPLLGNSGGSQEAELLQAEELQQPHVLLHSLLQILQVYQVQLILHQQSVKVKVLA